MDRTDLYRHFDEEGRLLYVGVSFGTIARLQQHRVHSHWYGQIRKVTVQKFASRVAAHKAERRAIAEEKPLYNIAHVGRPPRVRRPAKPKPKPRPQTPMFGPPAPYKGRPVGLVSGEVPEGFPVPPERIFRAEVERAVERVIKVCWPEDTIHVLNAEFPANMVPKLESEGIHVVFH